MMRPSRPDPATFAASRPFSAINLLAEGAFSTSFPVVAAAGAAAAAAGAATTAPDDEMTASLAVASTVLPSGAVISAKTPAAGAGTSTDTLSVSSSHSISSWAHSISSWATASPTALNHVDTVASVTLSPRVGTITSTESPPAGAAAAGAAAAGAGAAPSPATIVASSASTPTVSPSAAIISPITPAAGAGTSTVTLSVSNSHSISSTAMASPGFLNQVATVASVTLSPSVGTRTSVMDQFPSMVSAAFTSAACCALCWLASPVAGDAEAARPA